MSFSKEIFYLNILSKLSSTSSFFQGLQQNCLGPSVLGLNSLRAAIIQPTLSFQASDLEVMSTCAASKGGKWKSVWAEDKQRLLHTHTHMHMHARTHTSRHTHCKCSCKLLVICSVDASNKHKAHAWHSQPITASDIWTMHNDNWVSL